MGDSALPLFSNLALSDLARAVSDASAHSKPQMRFRVDHIEDTAGHFFNLLSESGTSKMSAARETLSFAAHGVGVVILSERDVAGSASWNPGAPSVAAVPVESPVGLSFSGYARPNPTFLYDTGAVIEGIVTVEDEPRSLMYGHAIALRELAAFIADLASEEFDSPILSFQSPAQAPPHSHQKADLRARRDEWPRSTSHSLRFAVALRSRSAASRFDFVDKLVAYCRERGFGTWVNDTRDGYRAGVWFGVVTHDRTLARHSHPTYADRRGDRQAHVVMPVTIVGPARVGSTSAVLAYLSRAPEVGLVACSVTSLDDLAFIHLQLVLNHSAGRKVAAKNVELKQLLGSGAAGVTQKVVAPRSFIDSALQMLVGEPLEIAEDRILTSRLIKRSGDYQVLAGSTLR